MCEMPEKVEAPLPKKKKARGETLEEIEERIRNKVLAQIKSGKIRVEAPLNVRVHFYGYSVC